MEEKMKKTLSFLAVILMLFFAVSCDDGKKDDKVTVVDHDEENVDDTDAADTDTDTDTTHENPDSENPDYGDSGNKDDADSADSENGDDADSADSENGNDDDGEQEIKDVDLIGRYNDNWGGNHIISKTAWFQPSSYGDTLFHIKKFENNFIIAQNDAVKAFPPNENKWSRFDFFGKGDKIYYCQTAYDKETEADALATDDADKTDLEKGCNSSPWTELVEAVEEGIDKDDPKIVAWATGYEKYQVGEGVDEKWQTPEKALGKAVGDSFDVVVLGDGGSIVLTFNRPIVDGEGADFAVFENSFDDKFLELGTVEVSSDGEHFVAFDHYYLGVEKIGSTGGHDARLIHGFAGKFKQGVGTMFDLAELAGKPEILDGTLDLNAITHVKIVDVIGDGSQLDSIGNPVYDPYPTSGSAGFDLDAVAVINSAEPLEISGKWYDFGWGHYEILSEKGRTQINTETGPYAYPYTMSFDVVKYNNETDTLIVYKADTKYSKVNWILEQADEKEILYICEIAYNQNTVEDAEAAEDADKTQPATGCGGNPWNSYVRAGTTSEDNQKDLYAEREKAADKDDDYIDVWASGYGEFKPGTGADTAQNDPEAVKGKADGKFVSLGKGGSILVKFTDPLPLDGGEMNEIGSDFIIFGNSADSHALAKVEVSSDGKTFVAFDTYFIEPQVIDFNEDYLFGFAGKFSEGKGTKFDLQDLSLKDEVQNKKVNLEAIKIIRITDIPGDGSVMDSHGNPIFYPYPAGGFELDAVATVK